MQSQSEVTALEDGRFMVSWYSNANNDLVNLARVFDVDGEVVEEGYVGEDDVLSLSVTTLLDNDLLPDDDFVFSIEGAHSANGAGLSYDADTGTVTYDPTASNTLQSLAQGDTLEDSFTYTVTAAGGVVEHASVTIVVGGMDELLG